MAAIFVISFILSTIVGGLIGKSKGYTSTGVVLGLILGWIGVLILACMKPSQEVQIRRAQEHMAIWAAAGQRLQGQVVPGQMPPPPGALGAPSPEVQRTWQEWGDQ